MNKAPYASVDISDRVILITGCTSTMGRPVVRLCAERGAALVLFDEEGDGLREAEAEAASFGGSVTVIAGDLLDESAVRGAVAEAVRRHDSIDGAFNAGVKVPPFEPLIDVELDTFRKTQDYNVAGMFLCLKHEIRQMLTQPRGASIVNLGSESAVKASPDDSVYVTSKHAVLGLTRSAAMEYSSRGIRVNAVMPGLLKHPLSATMLEDPAMAALEEQRHPIGRFGELSEMAETVTWLLSEASSFMTGAPVFVDGGASAV